MPSALARILRAATSALVDSLTASTRTTRTTSHTSTTATGRVPAEPTAPGRPGSGHTSSPTPVVADVAEALAHVSYAPTPDGDADPGEVVWTWIPYEEDATRGKDRPVVVLGRSGADLYVAQMTSKDHDRDAAQEARWGRHWMDIGSGAWDPKGRPSEVRLDRVLLVRADAVRREGATLPRGTFDAVVRGLGEVADRDR